MWTRIAFLLVVLAAATAEFGWKSGHEYTYQVTSKTLTGHETTPQYSGLVVKAQMAVRANSEQELVAIIDHAEKSQIHTELRKGHEFEIPQEILKFQPLTLTKQPFIIRLKEGIVDEIVISKEVPIWEVNVIKSIVSQFQVDTQGKRIIASKLNAIPQKEDDVTAVFKIMEDTVEGECEVLYDITPLPKYILQRKPYLAPVYNHKSGEHLINIVKTKNFTNCEHRPGYHYGITGMTQWEPSSNTMGNFLSRSSVGKVILSGNLKKYTIHSSETTNMVTHTPQFGSEDKSIVLSRVNLTLISVGETQRQTEQPTHPQSIKNLVYSYNHPTTANDQEARQKWDQGNELPSGRNNVRSNLNKNRFGRSITGSGNTNKYSSDSSSSESISTESWHQEIPQLTLAPQNPFLPYFIGCSGHSIQHCENVNLIQVVKKLSEQIGTQLQEPNTVPQTSTLERFTILVRVIRNMNAKQLQQVTEELWVQKEGQNEGAQSPRRSYWFAFRDAVAQAGTGPALMTIKQWIHTDKIHREEAAQIVASLYESTMHPTSEYMKTFFELVKDPKVMNQEYLNTSAVYSFTKLVRLAQVDRNTIHNRYPVHSFGRFTPADDRVVAEEYIPYLASQLQQAVQQQDSPKIQVYIRALGNTGHPKILSVFEPYLEGQTPITDFQRTLVIASLNTLARTHPRIARSVLYKTFSNIGEVHQVRVAAIYNLMRTVPPVNMLQRMAQASHDDPSIQVRSAIKSAIESAALLESPFNAELRSNAQAAVNMLTPEVYGVHYSRKNITDFVLKGLHYGYTDTLSYIGSEDSLIPSSVFYQLTSQIQGFQRKYFKFGVMVSSVQDLVDFFDSIFSVTEGQTQGQTGKNEEWTYDKITKMLNIEHELMKQIEGNVLYRLAGAERYFAFDNHTIDSWMEKLVQLPYVLAMGHGSVYQKLYNSHVIHVGFPTATGLPFVYTMETPRLLLGKGKVQLRNDGAQKTTGGKSSMTGMAKFGGSVNVQGVYSSRTESRMGFVTPFDHQSYISGVHQEHQVNIPVRMEVDVDLSKYQMKLEVQPIDKNGELKIFQYNTKKYTAVEDLTEFKPITGMSNVKVIKIRQPHKFEHIIGNKGGLGVRVEVETQKRHLDWQTLQLALTRHSMVSPLVFPTAGVKIANTKIDVYYDKTFAKSVVFTVGVYGSLKRTKTGEKIYTAPEQGGLVQEVLGKIKEGITSPEAIVVDLGLEVKGDKSNKYTTVFGYGYSPVADENQYVVRYQKQGSEKPYELCMDATTKMPFVPETDFTNALQNQPKGQVRVDLRFGENGCKDGAHVTLSGKFERTPERAEYLKKLPQVQSCLNEMKDDNKLLSGCMNATFNANLLNRYVFVAKYDKVPVVAKNITYQVYSFLRHLGYPYLTEKLTPPQGSQENKIELDVHFSPDLRTVNTYVSSPIGNANFQHVRVNKYVRSLLVVHPTWDVVRRFGWSGLRQQYDAYCTIDKTKARTFDNMTYPIQLGGFWIPAFVSVPKIDQEGQLVGVHKVAVLTKETPEKLKEVVILTSGNSNEFQVVAHIKPTSSVDAQVTINGEDIKLANKLYEYFSPSGDLILQVYLRKAGQEMRTIFVLPECEFSLVYGFTRFQVIAEDIYKNRVLGLCGDYNGERYDYVTPKGKFLRDPQEFVASWALTNEGPYAQLKERVEKNSVRKTVTFTGVVSDQDAGRTDKRGRQFTKEQQLRGYYDSSSSSSSESNEQESECMTKRIMVIERDGKHCFSIKPQPACKSGCQVEKTTPMTAKFICVNKTQTSAHWAQMVTRGANPNFGEKLNNVQELTFQAPVECSKI